MVFVFFFQAEDGIRDDLVTGVQTCALPISKRFARRPSTLPPTPRVCAIPPSAPNTSLLAPASLKPDARPSSVRASNNPVCSGRSSTLTTSSPCAAATSTVASRTTGSRGGPLDLNFYFAHPSEPVLNLFG